ncbi:hypothetical protein F5Y17DRAFT_466948 [Xylariaceae sp. FL0594]|nr:hypothetical protein F5Y17DRAFT_466948 [Xylariaceae sp. FL0594]
MDLLPLPVGVPPVAADFRAALCQSLPYWKAHQGGVHSNEKIATGMLMNGATTPRDIVQNQVIITTIGSGFDKGPDGNLIRTADQSEVTKNYVVLRNTMTTKTPIAIIAGKKLVVKAKGKTPGHYENDLFDVQLSHRYNVLDWFHVTDIWAEYQPTQADGTRYKHYMLRLEKVDLTGPSWWAAPENVLSNLHTVGEFTCHISTCGSCGTSHKQIFEEGWCCLEKNCPKFFHFENKSVNIDDLHYAQDFLNERTRFTGPAPQPLVPSLPKLGDNFGSEANFKDGIICPNCRFASRRIDWDGWRCEKGCGFTHIITPAEVPIDTFDNELKSVMKTPEHQFDTPDARVHHTVSDNLPGYKVDTFYLPGSPMAGDDGQIIGSVTVLTPTEETMTRPGGVNDLYKEINEAAADGKIKLQRHAARCRGSHLEELTSHFSCNMGADYKFGVVVETSNGFDSAPDAILKALSRLTWAGKTAIGLVADDVAQNARVIDDVSMPNEFIEFNEQLILGYFEKSQISFHDDGEKELGPTVATMSLGSPSIMKFRCKSKSGIETANTNRVMLSFVSKPGTIVIMHGTKIHKYYEHAVFAAGIRRYALTCRFINPASIADPERRAKAIKNGEVPSEWKDRAYNGEEVEANL